MAAEFVVESVFVIKGRGPVINRGAEPAKAARLAGELFEPGDMVRCGDLEARVVGIEGWAIPSPPQQGLLLRGVELGQLYTGQVWTRVAPVEPAEPEGERITVRATSRQRRRQVARMISAGRHMLPRDQPYAGIPVWCSAEERPEARTQAEARLTELMGDNYGGGIRFVEVQGAEALVALEELRANQTPGSRLWAYYNEVESLLATLGGFVVVALAPGRKPVSKLEVVQR